MVESNPVSHSNLEEKLLYENLLNQLREDKSNDESWNRLLDIINENFPHEYRTFLQLMVRRRRDENLNYISSKTADNFLTYMTAQGIRSFVEMPLCCQHVSIAYFIWNRQNYSLMDPTAVGRKIKRAHIIVH